VTDNERDKRSRPAEHLMAIAEKGNMNLMKQEPDDRYLAEKKEYKGLSMGCNVR